MTEARPPDEELCSACSRPPRFTTSGEKVPLRKCTRCRTVAYHDVTCQKRHYPIHKKVCRQLGDGHGSGSGGTANPRNAWFCIESRTDRGQCMVATRPIKPNEALWNFVPVAPPVLLESRRSTHCAICFAPNTECVLNSDARYMVFACQGCRSVSKNHVQFLRQEIDAVKMTPQIPKILATAILVYRICTMLLQKTIAWKDVECMIAHPLERDEDAGIHQQAIVLTVTSLLQASSSSSSSSNHGMTELSRIQGILARIKVNAFTITDATTGEALGIGLYGGGANFINHSCVPNLLQSFSTGIPGQLPALNIVSTKDGAIAQGQELTISYFDATTTDRETRHAELLRSYHFTCECSACSQQLSH